MAKTLQERSPQLTREWLEELRQSLDVAEREAFPAHQLLDDVPAVLARLLRRIGGDDEPADRDFIQEKLRGLVALRGAQGLAIEDLLADFEVLHRILIDAAIDEMREMSGSVAPEVPMGFALELQRALQLLSHEARKLDFEAETADRASRSTLLASFARGVVHELRNRLNASLLTLSAYRAAPQERDESLLDNLDSSLRRLGSAVDHVFEISRAQSQQGLGRGLRCPVSQPIDRVRNDLGQMADASGVEIRIREPIPDALVDSFRTELVLLNLVSNSIKYSDPDKGQRWVEIAVEADPTKVRIDVRDNGIGMTSTTEEEAFEEGHRGDNAAGIPGDGLGLGLVRQAVEQMGGKVWLSRAELGGGTTVSMELPPR